MGMAETPRETPGRTRPGELHRRRVVLLAESAGLVGVLGHLLGPADRLGRVGSLRELAGSRSLDTADVVVLDLPGEDQAAAGRQGRRHYRGPLVVLAGEGAPPAEPLAEDACTVLARPFSVDELAAALSVPGRTLAAAAAARWSPAARAAPALPAAPGAAPGRLDRLADRAVVLLIALVESWRTRRQVRVAGFTALAVVAFAVAFAVAAHGRCGPGCDPLGTGLSPTIASVGSRAPSTTGPRQPASTTIIRAGTPGTGAFLGTSGRRRAGTTSDRSAATTTRPATTRPATTRPATTPSTAPPTTAPPTTKPPTTPPPPTTVAEAPASAPTQAG